MNNIDQAKAHIDQLVSGLQYEHVAESTNQTSVIVSCTVIHPKRKLTPSSFARAAKKHGLTAYGTRSATGPTLIVAYINITRTIELKVTGTNDDKISIEVRTML